MVAGLLYLIGLISVLVSVAMVGYAAPSMYQTFAAAMDAGEPNMLGVLGGILGGLGWAVTPLIGGLVLMGLGRIIMLLAAISRTLRRAQQQM